MFVDKWKSVFPFWKSKINNEEGISYQWPAKWLPLLNIRTKANNKKRPKVAVGLIAVGDISVGLISCGGIALGAISAGGVAFGILSVGGVAHTWAIGVGAVAVVFPLFDILPGFGIGAMVVAMKGIGIGAIAIAHFAIGALAIGPTAFGLVSIGSHGWGLISLAGDAIEFLKHIFD